MFGQLLQQMRARSRVSLRELGRAVGLSAVYLSDIEAGSRRPPAPATVRKIAQCLGVDPVPLLRASLAERNAIELPISRDEKSMRLEAALALARTWDELDEEDLAEITRFLDEKREQKGQSA